jgi:Galactosyltransferase
VAKLMICVKSCQRDLALGFHDVIRSTWGRDAKALNIETRFFMGVADNKSYSPRPDEVYVKCGDDYNSLPYKTREICRWANGKMVDYIFLCDNDTFLIPRKMLQCGFEKHDYVGKIGEPVNKRFRYEHTGREGQKEIHERCFQWASGGYGYFLSRKAFQEVAFETPTSSCEDLWVGQVIGRLAAEGEASILSTPADAYSWHSPHHGEIYDLKTLKDWQTRMHAENKV